jgi:SAM-dependent methyltransferase
VTDYERYSRFYDAVMDDPGPRAERVLEWIDRYVPEANSLLELGCGTGSILARLPSVGSLTGVDRSPAMLAVARGKVPGARLIEDDMQAFSFDERFDVVICVFDSLNHLLDFNEWQETFSRVRDHLVDGGLFVFDVNTIGELRRLGEEPPWVFDFPAGLAIVDVLFAEDDEGNGMSNWDIRIFEQVGVDKFQLHREEIGELGVRLGRLRSALVQHFVVLDEVSESGGTPTDESVKAHFACRPLAPSDHSGRAMDPL